MTTSLNLSDQWFFTRSGNVPPRALGNVEGEHFKLSLCMGTLMVENPRYLKSWNATHPSEELAYSKCQWHPRWETLDQMITKALPSISLKFISGHWKHLKWCWAITLSVCISHLTLNSVLLGVKSDPVMTGEDMHGTLDSEPHCWGHSWLWVQKHAAAVQEQMQSQVRVVLGFGFPFMSSFPQREEVGLLWSQACSPGSELFHWRKRRLSQQLFHCTALWLGPVASERKASLCRQVMPRRSTHLLSQARPEALMR